ncbi:MAG: cysteine--tRNA ligase [Candidatus Gastranaerophilaceae bacterium]|jgi:cysteinyl-tRNA synthetase
MKVFDSYSQELKEFSPIEENKVKMYVCGPTVYDFPHLGHARCYITWDITYRYLKFRGYDVTYTRNITDIDDKIINKAKKENTTPQAIAKKFTEEFKKSMEKLNILSPDIEPKATENIEEMLDIIKKLIDKGYAYESNCDVYFRVNKFENYGKLSKQSINDLESGARVETSEIKENPLDFALWKAVKSVDEIGWESPWGKGRPGWHIECSAMSRKYLGETIDIHAGGQDLLFPHHENEIAQSECSSGKQFVKYWLHNGFVTINEEKMSKSLGNFISINNLLEKYDANTIRFFILTNHYRSPVEFNEEALNSAKAGVTRLKNAYEDVKKAVSEELIIRFKEALTGNDTDNQLNEELMDDNLNFHIGYNPIDNFKSAMDEDFNTSKALAVLFELAGNAQKTKDTETELSAQYIAVLDFLAEILGLELKNTAQLDNQLAEQFMNIIISIRKDARETKNWALSDKIRGELDQIGITLKDNKDGTTNWSVKD